MLLLLIKMLLIVLLVVVVVLVEVKMRVRTLLGGMSKHAALNKSENMRYYAEGRGFAGPCMTIWPDALS